MIADNVENVHFSNGDMFTYMYSMVQIIDEKKKSPKLLDPSKKTELKEI